MIRCVTALLETEVVRLDDGSGLIGLEMSLQVESCRSSNCVDEPVGAIVMISCTLKFIMIDKPFFPRSFWHFLPGRSVRSIKKLVRFLTDINHSITPDLYTSSNNRLK